MLLDEAVNQFAVGGKSAQRRLFVLPHEAAVAEDVGTEYGGELTLKYAPPTMGTSGGRRSRRHPPLPSPFLLRPAFRAQWSSPNNVYGIGRTPLVTRSPVSETSSFDGEAFAAPLIEHWNARKWRPLISTPGPAPGTCTITLRLALSVAPDRRASSLASDRISPHYAAPATAQTLRRQVSLPTLPDIPAS